MYLNTSHGLGIVRLTEQDMKANGGAFFMLKENVIAIVADQPGIAVVVVGDDGKRLEEVVWSADSKLHILTVALGGT